MLPPQLSPTLHVQHDPSPSLDDNDRARLTTTPDASAIAQRGSILNRRRGVSFSPAPTNITKTLEKIRTAQVPARFSQDFLATTLNLSGGGARPVVPFLKRTGFLASDGTPTDRYRRFRNDSERGAAAAEALRTGYTRLYEVNEYIHDATDAALKGVVVQVTGAEPQSTTVKAIVGSFKALKAFASFDGAAGLSQPQSGVATEGKPAEATETQDDPARFDDQHLAGAIKLGYTINLNLPATSEIAVFDAIFKSLREHLL